MNAAARTTATHRRTRRRRRLLVALLVAIGTLLLGATVNDPAQEPAPLLMALAD